MYMVIDDRSKIKEIILKFPRLMAEDSKKYVMERFYDIRSKREKLASLRMEAMKLEQELREEEKEFNEQSSLFDIVFEKKEITEIKEDCYMSVVNPSDYRNVH